MRSIIHHSETPHYAVNYTPLRNTAQSGVLARDLHSIGCILCYVTCHMQKYRTVQWNETLYLAVYGGKPFYKTLVDIGIWSFDG